MGTEAWHDQPQAAAKPVPVKFRPSNGGSGSIAHALARGRLGAHALLAVERVDLDPTQIHNGQSQRTNGGMDGTLLRVDRPMPTRRPQLNHTRFTSHTLAA